MRFLNAVATIALGLAAAAHGHVQIMYPPLFLVIDR